MNLLILILSLLLNYSNSELNQANSYEYILYSSNESGNPEIYLMRIDGKEKKKLTSYEGRDGYPACSPDCSRIAFYAYFDKGQTWSICVMDANGKNRKRLTFEKNVNDTSPIWSKDGKQIIFGRDTHEAMEIWIMNADGSKLRKIESIQGGTPSFTPDGNIIYCSHWNETGEICIIDTDGNPIRQLTNNEVGEWFVEISPDGEKIVYSSEGHIFVMNIDGTGSENLTPNEGPNSSPHWSPDGEKILFTSKRDGDYDIYVMKKDGSGVKNITNNDFADIQANWTRE